MSNSHKWHDAIVALAEGREIQCKNKVTGEWMEPEHNAIANPISSPEFEWRVKPREPREWIACVFVDPCSYVKGQLFETCRPTPHPAPNEKFVRVREVLEDE